MDSYTSTADMYAQMETKQQWKRQNTKYGFTLTPPAHFAKGYSSVWGNLETCFFIESDVVFLVPLIERYHFKEKSIKISLIEDMTGTYYKKKEQVEEACPGLICHVNNIPQVYFKRLLAHRVQKVYTIGIVETFFAEQNILLPPDAWDKMAAAINGKVVIPKLANIVREIRNLQVDCFTFDLIFRAKVIEVIALLWEYTLELEKNGTLAISKKSRRLAKQALQILNDTYINPPVIDRFADSLGIDVNTLQRAFKQLVGKTVYEYIVSLRMEKAVALLEDKSLTVENISKMVGYQSKISFYKAFEKTYNCKPNEFRKHMLNE